MPADTIFRTAAILMAIGAPPAGAQSGVAEWAGVWRGALVNLPLRAGAPTVDVTREIGPLPSADSTCGLWRTTYAEAGVTKGVKDYQLCRGAGPDDLYLDEGGGVRLSARWIGDVLVSPFKFDDLLLVSTIRLRGEVLEEEILTAGDKPAVSGALPLPARGIQRLTLYRVAPVGRVNETGADWAALRRYRKDNATLSDPVAGEQRVVFMGDSITEAWAEYFGALFPGKPYLGRGISGQTTPQMVLRFRQDVIALKPRVVVILGGTNDIAGNTGPSTLGMIEDNLESMVEMARANGIKVVLVSVLPVFDYPWRPGLEPAPKIVALNAWMKRYSAGHGAVFLDLHAAMTDERQGMRREFSEDGVHPNESGYRAMAPLVKAAILTALGRR